MALKNEFEQLYEYLNDRKRFYYSYEIQSESIVINKDDGMAKEYKIVMSMNQGKPDKRYCILAKIYYERYSELKEMEELIKEFNKEGIRYGKELKKGINEQLIKNES